MQISERNSVAFVHTESKKGFIFNMITYKDNSFWGGGGSSNEQGPKKLARLSTDR